MSIMSMILSKRAVPIHPIAQRRSMLGWSQQELAARAGLPRSSLSAIESRRLVPSVAAALMLSRALDCSVEESFGDIGETPIHDSAWAWAPSCEPCRYWEAEVGATRWLYPVESLARNATPHDGVWTGGVPHGSGTDLATSTLVLACCDPAAGLLTTEYAQESGLRMILLPRSGMAALDLLRAGRIHVAGLHRSTIKQPQRNVETMHAQVGKGYRLVRAAHWVTGLALPASSRARSVRWAALRARRWALREQGAAAQECLEELREGRPAAGRVVSSHAGVAEAVRAGWAEAGICVQIAAQEAGLHFLPIQTEALDLCFSTQHAGDRRIQALLRLLRSRSHRRIISDLPGYDAREAGEGIHPC